MATKDPYRDDDLPAERGPMQMAAFLLCLYVAMHLIVGAILHVLTPPEATTVATTRPTSAIRINPTASVADADESSTVEVIGKALLWGTIRPIQSKPKGGGELRGINATDARRWSYLPSGG